MRQHLQKQQSALPIADAISQQQQQQQVWEAPAAPGLLTFGCNIYVARALLQGCQEAQQQHGDTGWVARTITTAAAINIPAQWLPRQKYGQNQLAPPPLQLVNINAHSGLSLQKPPPLPLC